MYKCSVIISYLRNSKLVNVLKFSIKLIQISVRNVKDALNS